MKELAEELVNEYIVDNDTTPGGSREFWKCRAAEGRQLAAWLDEWEKNNLTQKDD